MAKQLLNIMCFVILLVPIYGATSMDNLNLVPMPQEIKILDSKTSLSEDWKICVDISDPDDRYSAELLAEEVESAFGWKWEIIKSPPEKDYVFFKSYELKGDEPELFKEQGYFLRIDTDRITIEAPTTVGRFYAVQTLRQLIRTATSPTLTCLFIKDYPALQWRGISDDISRGQVSHIDDFLHIIRQLAFYKKNLYQPYIEDMFSFDTDPNIGRDRGHITKTEMARMVEEAKRNHIVLVPVFECLGHQDRLLSLPENRKYAEVQDPEKKPWSFSPVLPETFEFLTKLIDELASVTPAPFFHIGGDESWDIGEGTSAKLVKKIGVGRVHAQFFTRLHDYIKQKHNRLMMLYSDMLLRHPEALDFLPKDCILIDWHYGQQEDYPSVKQLKDAGFHYIIASPAIWSWNAFYPNYSYAFPNIAVFTAVAKREKILGCVTSSWGDNGAENLRENNWVGYAYSAAAEWESATPEDVDKFLKRFVAVHYGVDSPELAEALKKLGWLDYLESRYPARIFHRTPRLKPVDKEWLNKMDTLHKNMTSVRDTLSALRDRVRFNKDHLQVLDHVAQRYIYLALRDKIFDEIAHILGEKKSAYLPEFQRNKIIKGLETLRDILVHLTVEYERLWLRYNKYPKLDFNLERLQKQIAHLQKLIVLARSGELTAYAEPEAVWFWYPEPEPTRKASKATKYFIRVIQLDKDPVFAEIKFWGDDRARVFINGEKVGEASWGNPPAVFNVLPFLKKGRNYLAVEGFNAVGAAGILLHLDIRFQDKTKLVITGDEQWFATEKVKSKWTTSRPKGKRWKTVSLLGKGLIEPWTFLDW